MFRVSWWIVRPEVVNNGHTIQVQAGEGSFTTFGGVRYEFRQVHWHHTSEHAIAGEFAPLEAHFVHENPDSGELLVLGVMMVAGQHKGAAVLVQNGRARSECLVAEKLLGQLPNPGALMLQQQGPARQVDLRDRSLSSLDGLQIGHCTRRPGE